MDPRQKLSSPCLPHHAPLCLVSSSYPVSFACLPVSLTDFQAPLPQSVFVLSSLHLPDSLCVWSVSVPSCSFSFTFPRPPIIFNSVIMTYSVGTWDSESPTLHSHLRIPCDQAFLPFAARAELMPYHFPAAKAQNSLSPASCPLWRAKLERKTGATEVTPSAWQELFVGQCEVGMTPDIPRV